MGRFQWVLNDVQGNKKEMRILTANVDQWHSLYCVKLDR